MGSLNDRRRIIRSYSVSPSFFCRYKNFQYIKNSVRTLKKPLSKHTRRLISPTSRPSWPASTYPTMHVSPQSQCGWSFSGGRPYHTMSVSNHTDIWLSVWLFYRKSAVCTDTKWESVGTAYVKIILHGGWLVIDIYHAAQIAIQIQGCFLQALRIFEVFGIIR